MMTNVMVKTCVNQKIIKDSNLIQAIKNSVCPTANVTRRPIFSESRIFRSLPIVDSTHDMIIVKWHLLNFSKAKFVLSEYLPNVPKCGLNTRHDNREVTWSDVKWHLFSFSESRICPNIYRMFRSVDWTHDMIIVKWREVTSSDTYSVFPKAEFVRIFTECSFTECSEVWIEHITW